MKTQGCFILKGPLDPTLIQQRAQLCFRDVEDRAALSRMELLYAFRKKPHLYGVMKQCFDRITRLLSAWTGA